MANNTAMLSGKRKSRRSAGNTATGMIRLDTAQN